MPVFLQRNTSVGADALEGTNEVRLRPDLHKARKKRRALVPERLQKRISRLRTAELSSCAAARRDDQAVAEICLARHRARLIAARLLFDLADLAPADDRHARRLQRKAQHIDHAVRLIGERVHAPRGLRHRDESQRLKRRERPLHAVPLERRKDKPRRLAVVIFRAEISVREIAAACRSSSVT